MSNPVLGKDKKDIVNLSSAEIAHRVVKVKPTKRQRLIRSSFCHYKNTPIQKLSKGVLFQQDNAPAYTSVMTSIKEYGFGLIHYSLH